jgi:phage terminase small subunit
MITPISKIFLKKYKEMIQMKEEKELFKKIKEALQLNGFVDDMLIKQFVYTYIEVKKIEEQLRKEGDCYKDRNGRIKVNPLISIVGALNNDLMRFYRMFYSRVPKSQKKGEESDFLDLLNKG